MRGGKGGFSGGKDAGILAPAVKKSRAYGINVSGPISADTLFWHALKGKFDVVLALYHDQGLAPFKMLAFENGVQITLGLPFIRTSPDHGPAFDIAGTSKASHKSFWEAVSLAALMIKREKRFQR